MSPIQVRGYTITTALKYVDNVLRADEKSRVLEKLGSDYNVFKNHNAVEWRPSSELAKVFSSIASLADGDDERALTRFLDLGKFVGTEATNTFLRLFMRLMTPSAFAGRLPTLFKRDMQGDAHLVVDRATQGELVCTFHDVEGFDHITAVGVGWVAFGLEAMGKVVTDRKIDGWKLVNPAPMKATVTVRWRD